MGKVRVNRDEVIAAMDGTRTAQEIADQFGMLRTSVYTIYMEQHGRGAPVKLKPVRRQGVGKSTRVEQLVALADGTRTRAQIAAAMGIAIASLAGYEGAARQQGHELRTIKAERTGTLWQRMVAFCESGDRTREEIAAHLGVSEKRVLQIRALIRRRHKIECRIVEVRQYHRDAPPKARPSADPARAIVEPLAPHVVEWLQAQMPEGATLADLIRSIIVDQYHDDVDAQQAAKLACEVAA